MNDFMDMGIKFILPTDEVEQFVKGWSGDKTFKVKRGNQRFFLKIICKNHCNFKNFDIYTQLNIKTPQILEKGKLLNERGFYYITDFINGRDLGDAFDDLSDEFIYETAKNIGSQQKKISELFPPKRSIVENENELFSYYEQKIDQFFNLLENYKDKIEFEYRQIDLYRQLLKIINRAKKSFNNEFLYYCHDDCMPNNFMIDDSNQIWTIDIEDTKYDFFAKKLRGYIQHIINKPNAKKFQIFFRGYLTGFFSLIPKNLDAQMEYIYLVDLFDICLSSLQENDVKEFQNRAKMLISYNHKDIRKLFADLILNNE